MPRRLCGRCTMERRVSSRRTIGGSTKVLRVRRGRARSEYIRRGWLMTSTVRAFAAAIFAGPAAAIVRARDHQGGGGFGMQVARMRSDPAVPGAKWQPRVAPGTNGDRFSQRACHLDCTCAARNRDQPRRSGDRVRIRGRHIMIDLNCGPETWPFSVGMCCTGRMFQPERRIGVSGATFGSFPWTAENPLAPAVIAMGYGPRRLVWRI